MSKERLVVELEKDLKSKFKDQVEKEGTTMKHVLEEFIHHRSPAEHTPSQIGHKDKGALSSLHGSISAGTEKAVDAYLSIRPLVLRQISKKFKGEDIKSMAGVLKGSSWDPTYASSTSVLVSKLSMELDNETDKTRQSKLAILIETIKTISPAECYFLQEEIFRRIA